VPIEGPTVARFASAPQTAYQADGRRATMAYHADAEGGLLLAPVDLIEPESYAGSARIEIVGVQYYA
jgi:hypothetical protein